MNHRGTALFGLSVVLCGCGLIINGSSQNIGISSIPDNAKVTIDNQPRGNTPLFVDLKRKDNHVVKLELPGYQPFEATMTRGVSGWVWGNILFGGLIGLAVDAISGGMYILSPEQVQAAMAEEKKPSASSSDTIYIRVVLRPDFSWRKIGSLVRLSPRSVS